MKQIYIIFMTDNSSDSEKCTGTLRLKIQPRVRILDTAKSTLDTANEDEAKSLPKAAGQKFQKARRMATCEDSTNIHALESFLAAGHVKELATLH